MKFPEFGKMKSLTRGRLRSVYKIIEYRDGCIYKTKFIGYIACKPDYKLLTDSPNYQIGSVSTTITRELI